MSYSILSTCFSCDKKETCTDLKRVNEAIQLIHSTSKADGHQGRGWITLTCTVHNTKVE